MSAKYRFLRPHLAVGIIFLAALFLWAMFLRERDPGYRGRPLGHWLQQMNRESALDPKSEPAIAIRAIGTNALGPLLNELKARDSYLRALLLKQHVVRFESAADRVKRASFGLVCLREMAVPELEEMLNEDPDHTYAAVVTLARMCPTGASPLARGLTNGEISVRQFCASAFSSFADWKFDGYSNEVRATASIALPALDRALSDTNFVVQELAARALGKLAWVDSRFVLQSLTKVNLANSHPFVVKEVTNALAQLRSSNER